MASQYSILRQYAPYVSPYNIDLVKDVMLYKQQKVDAAREQIYTQVDYLMGQEIDKPEARAYMEDKMSGVIANINEKFRGVDLSSDGVARAIQGEVSSVLDDTVINAIAGTKEGKRVMKEIESIKQNHPELYSPINEWYAMSPYYEWQNDGNAGSRLGSLHYSPYIDYNAELNKLVSDFRKNNEGKKLQTTEYDVNGKPTGGIIEVNIDELSDSQIRNFVSANLSENMRNQMRIEASYMAATNPVFRDPNMVNQYLSSYIGRYDRYIGALEAKKKSVGDSKDLLDRIDSQIQETKNQKAEASREVGMIIESGDPVAAANFVVTNNLFDKMSDTWRYDNTSYERKKDDLYFARLEENREQQKFLTDNAKAMADIALTNEKLAQAKIETQFMQTYGRRMGTKDVSGTEGAGGMGAPMAPGDGPAVINAGTGKTGSIYLANVPYNQITSASTERKANLLKLYNSLSPTDRSNIIAATYEEERSEPGLYSNMTPEERIYSYLKNNGGQKNGYFGQGNNRMSEAYDALLDSDSKVNGAAKELSSLSDYQIENIVTGKNKDVIKNIRNSGFMRGNSFLGLTDTDDKAGAFLLATAISSGANIEAESFRDYMLNPARGLDLISAISPSAGAKIGAAKLGKTITDAVTGGPNGTATGTLALINGMKKLNGDPDFNISDYVTIDKDGDIDIKDYVEGEPLTITQLRYVENNKRVSDMIASQMKDEINMAVSPDQVSDRLSQSHYLDSYRRYNWNADAPEKSLEKAQIRELSSIMAGKIEGLNPAAINTINMDTEIDNGVVRRFLTAQGGTGSNSFVTERVEVTNDELLKAGFDPSAQQRNYPVDGYKSGFGTCDFVDTGKKEGHSYDKYLVKNDLPGLASKLDVKNGLYSTLETYGSYLKPEDMNVFKTLVDNFVDMSDKISVQLEGVDDRGAKEITVNFYDKRTKNSKNPALLFSDFVPLDPGNDEYADYWHNIHSKCPQYFFVKYVREALQERLDNMRNPYMRKLSITPDNNDKFSKLNDFLQKLYGGR